jgi:hypothetical protein
VTRFPSPTLPLPAGLLREPDHTGAVALRAELFTVIGGRGAEVDGVLRGAAAAPKPSGLALLAGNVARWLG